MAVETRPTRAALCLAIAVFSTVLAAAAFLDVPILLLAAWQLAALSVVPVLVFAPAEVAHAPTDALLSLAHSRPPPPLISFQP